MSETLTQGLVRELFAYETETGFLIRHDPKGKARTRADRTNGDGYRCVSILGRQYLAHRIIWLLVHGEFPPGDLDHVNMNRADNRLVNLRPATRSQNNANSSAPRTNKTGFKGVSWDKARKKWHASIKVNQRSRSLGRFDSREAAHAAYVAAAAQSFGDFARAA